MIAAAVQDSIVRSERTGVLLSGGVDSSTIAAHAKGLPTFTGYYEGEAYDERKWAHLSKSLDHHDILITPEDFVEHFDAMLAAVTPPIGGTGLLGQYVVAQYASNHVEALLSGEGGDELFGGYARLLIVAGEPPPDGYEDYVLPDDYPTDLQAALDHDFEALSNLCRLDEQIVAAHGLHVTAPMLSDPIVEFVTDLPPEFRVNKRLLKTAMRGIVPDAVLDRTDKRGFPTPFVAWAQSEPVKSFVGDRIGYLPNPEAPWDRTWWEDLCEASAVAVAA
jgi:asparagine synthetase B (glutamine-hydrolysing)